jgi:hypothetical protein
MSLFMNFRGRIMDVAASQLDGNYVRDEVADRYSFFVK